MDSDKQKLQSLVYWQGVHEEEREAFIRSIQFDLEYRLKSVAFVPLNRGEKLEYSERGVVFRPSLPQVGRLIATYEDRDTLSAAKLMRILGVRLRCRERVLLLPAKAVTSGPAGYMS